jgi:hypothetical protein
MKSITAFSCAIALSIAIAASAQELGNDSGKKVQNLLFPDYSGSESEFIVLTGKDAEGKRTCFANIKNESSYLRVEVKPETKPEDDVPGKSKGASILFNIKKADDRGSLKVTQTEEGWRADAIRYWTNDQPTFGSLAVAFSWGDNDKLLRGDYSKVKAIGVTSASINSTVPALAEARAGGCDYLEPLVRLTESEGQKLAEDAAAKWNKDNPKKRKTGEVIFSQCEGNTARSIRCTASGEGEGDGDEPVLYFTYRVGKSGKLSLGEVEYDS